MYQHTLAKVYAFRPICFPKDYLTRPLYKDNMLVQIPSFYRLVNVELYYLGNTNCTRPSTADKH